MPKLFINGKIHTMCGADQQAMAVKGDRILAVGCNEDILALNDTNSTIIDLNGHCVVPGFNDSHCHIQHTGVGKHRLNLRGARSMEEIIERGREYILKEKPQPGTWIVGDGFDHNLFSTPVLPTRVVADAISTEYPILIERVCGHVGTVNTLGLLKMNFDEDTVIDGGTLDVGDDGRLNGILRENSLYRVTFSIPKTASDAELANVLESALREANSYGITSVQSDDLEATSLDMLDRAIAILREDGRLTARIYEEIQAPTLAEMKAFLARNRRTGAGDVWYKIGNIKLITDGSLGARTAYMREPYLETGGNGLNVYSDAEMQALVQCANEAGMQLAFHAIGDAALEQNLYAVELAQSQGRTGLRHRIVHGQFADEAQLKRIKAAGMAIDIQPAFTASDWKLVEPLLGAERLHYAYSWRDMFSLGISLGAGSDSPVETMNPLWGIYCAVMRLDEEGSPSGGWRKDQKISAYEALELYTVGGAYLSFEEGEKGKLAPGMLADFAVLSHDLLSVAPETIKDIQVLETFVGGNSVYKLGA